MLARLAPGLVLLALAGCAAESRTVYFLPLDAVAVVPRADGLAPLVEVVVEDGRPAGVLTVNRKAGKASELAIYPDVPALVAEVVANAADTALAAVPVDSTRFAITCRLERFDVSTRQQDGGIQVAVTAELELRSGGLQWSIAGDRRQVFDRTLVRADFQAVIHAALRDIADGVGAAMTELAGSSTI